MKDSKDGFTGSFTSVNALTSTSPGRLSGFRPDQFVPFEQQHGRSPPYLYPKTGIDVPELQPHEASQNSLKGSSLPDARISPPVSEQPKGVQNHSLGKRKRSLEVLPRNNQSSQDARLVESRQKNLRESDAQNYISISPEADAMDDQNEASYCTNGTGDQESHDPGDSLPSQLRSRQRQFARRTKTGCQ